MSSLPFDVEDYWLNPDELHEREMIDGVSAMIHHFGGSDEDAFMEKHMDLDEEGVHHWSTALTTMTMSIMGMTRDYIRSKYPSMPEAEFEKKWQLKFENVHGQLFHFCHEMD